MGCRKNGGVGSGEDDQTESRQRNRRLVPRAAARLVVVYPPALERIVPLGREPVVLGRKPESGVPIAHGTVSKHHFRITESSGALSGEDLDSHNGSWVDGAGVEAPVALHDGAVLRLGDVLAVVELGPVEPGGEALETALPGVSRGACSLRAAVARAGPDSSPALVVGETGVGKESIASEVHRLSRRRGPLLALNCAALSPQVFESQLFGHQKGAFTGAEAAQPGLIRAAEGGSLFLDEVGELPAELQPKLLRAIQQREVIPVGATRPVPVDVRLIAATNRDLEAEVERGAFRRDLYARLAMWEVRVPPLRDRRADLLGWLQRVQQRFCESRGQPQKALELDPDAAEAVLLARHDGNIRGLERLVHELSARAGQTVTRDDLPRWLVDASTAAPATDAKRPVPTKEELAKVLAETGSVRATARHFGRDRRQIYRWLEAHGLKAPASDD